MRRVRAGVRDSNSRVNRRRKNDCWHARWRRMHIDGARRMSRRGPAGHSDDAGRIDRRGNFANRAVRHGRRASRDGKGMRGEVCRCRAVLVRHGGRRRRRHPTGRNRVRLRDGTDCGVHGDGLGDDGGVAATRALRHLRRARSDGVNFGRADGGSGPLGRVVGRRLVRLASVHRRLLCLSGNMLSGGKRDSGGETSTGA